jgi:hypothetical protein
MNVENLAMPRYAPVDRHLVLARWLGYFMLVDLMFLPYFQALIMPFSLPLVVASLFVMGVKMRRDQYLLMFYFVAIGAFVSLGISMFDARVADYQMENIKRALQFTSTFAYFFYFRWLAERVPLRVGTISACFLVWFGLLAVAFYLDPSGTGEHIRAFYGKLVTAEETLAEHLRFSYQFTDPNTAAYFLLIAVAPLLLVKRSAFSFVLLTGVLLVLTFITQSKGALGAFALIVFTILFPPGRFVETALSLKRIVVLVGLVVAGYLAFVWISDIFESNKLLRLAYNRIFESPDQLSSGGGRFEWWTRYLRNFTPLPFGHGFILLMNGEYVRPHSDLIRIMFSYGLIALVPSLIWFFGRIISWAPLILPALTAFLINSLIDEQKMFALFLSLLAIQLGNEERKRRAALPAPDTVHAQ